MLLERSEILIREGQEAAFSTVMHDGGLAMLRGVAGVTAVHLGQGVENPTKFMLLVEWASMDAHDAFTQMPVYNAFRALFGPYAVGGAMEHFRMH